MGGGVKKQKQQRLSGCHKTYRRHGDGRDVQGGRDGEKGRMKSGWQYCGNERKTPGGGEEQRADTGTETTEGSV